MWTFAWKNLATRPLRTALALVGLSIPILGVLGLFSLSGGMRNLVGDTLSKIQGVVVLREGQLSPVFSDLPASVGPQIRALPNISAVAAEVWKVPPSVEGKSAAGQVVRSGLNAITKPRGGADQTFSSLFDMPILVGQEISSHQNLRGAIFPRAMVKGAEGGRFLQPGDENTNRVVISRKIGRDNKNPKTKKPKGVGDTLDIGGRPFEIIGVYDTGSMLLDVVIITDIATARKVAKLGPDTVSSFYVEATGNEDNDLLSARIESAIAGVDARGSSEILAGFSGLMDQLDLFLFATVLLALIVGVVGIINTMLMSTTERFAEFGVLRTNGWSRSNVLTLVTAESAYLGLIAGVVGLVLSVLFTVVANQFIRTSGLSLTISASNAMRGLGLSIVMGTLGGIYPAWRASRLVPMDAIRLGAR